MYFDNIKKNFGFGCMRLPMLNGEVDSEHFSRMIDRFMEEGFNYFDTAHGYIGGKSETAIRECLAKRYPRESYILTDKLTENYFNSEPDIRPFFETQLKACGVDYFDFYLMHAQNARNYKKFKECHAYETAVKLKEEGKIHHVGISFHDKADVLDMILTEQPEIEVVQIQFNYFDYEDAGVQSRLCYEVCRKHGKPVIVMEPVKGGSLVNLPDNAAGVFAKLGDKTPASYAIRFAAGFEGIMMVLSGMSNIDQMNDNISFMKDFVPLSDAEMEAVHKVNDMFHSIKLVQCTSCRYCIEGCPKKISIPDVFSCLNSYRRFKDKQQWRYRNITKEHGKASDCIKCGKCEKICPQALPIRELLAECAEVYDN